MLSFTIGAILSVIIPFLPRTKLLASFPVYVLYQGVLWAYTSHEMNGPDWNDSPDDVFVPVILATPIALFVFLLVVRGIYELADAAINKNKEN